MLIVNTETLAVERELRQGMRNTVASSTFTPDGRTLISCDADNNITFWNLASGLETMVIPRRNRSWFVMMSPDGNTLALRPPMIDSQLGNIDLWRPPSLAEIDSSVKRRKPPD